MKNKYQHPTYTSELLPVELYLRSVAFFPNRNALFINNTYYTYAHFHNYVVYILNVLTSEKKYNNIGVYCTDDVWTYAAIVAVSMYGAAYVPLTSKFPIERNKRVIEECKLSLIFSSEPNVLLENTVKSMPDVKISYTKMLTKTEKVMPSFSTILDTTSYRKVTQSTAYILFTSGTTGIPKGVPVSYFNLNSFFNFFLSNYDFDETDKFLQVYELTFDVSVFSFFMPLMVGACCYMVPDVSMKYLKTMEMLKTHNITAVSMVPSVLNYIQQYFSQLHFPALRYSFFSGDALYQSLAKEWSRTLPNGEIHNFYGPTETTIVCSRYIYDATIAEMESVNGIVPIGKLFDGLTYLLLDEGVPSFAKGELCLAGTQVIAAYLTDVNENSFIELNKTRYYKTGDIVSINGSGNLIFSGRADRQVKINGYRVELAEIDAAIRTATNLNSFTICTKNNSHLNILITFIETNVLEKIDINKIKALALAAYMIPSRLIAIKEFPMNSNGKIDATELIKKID